MNGSTNIQNVVNYLDDNVKGRRVDLNYQVATGIGHYDETIATGMNRTTLQALLWAGRKIGVLTSTKLNLTNTILPKLQVYNTPSTDFDVATKRYVDEKTAPLKSGNIPLHTAFISTGISIWTNYYTQIALLPKVGNINVTSTDGRIKCLTVELYMFQLSGSSNIGNIYYVNRSNASVETTPSFF
jgi:hypothetical protein